MYRPRIAALAAFLAVLSFAWPATAQEQPAQKPETEKVGDWEVACATADGGRKCLMSQRLNDDQNQKLLLIWLVGTDPKGQRMMILRTPQGILLTKGLVLTVDKKPPLYLSFRTCAQTFCEAIHPLDAALAAELGRATTLTVRMHNLQEKFVDLSVSPNGFSDALEKITPATE